MLLPDKYSALMTTTDAAAKEWEMMERVKQFIHHSLTVLPHIH